MVIYDTIIICTQKLQNPINQIFFILNLFDFIKLVIHNTIFITPPPNIITLPTLTPKEGGS